MSFVIRNSITLKEVQTSLTPEENEDLMSLKSARMWDVKVAPQRKLFKVPSFYLIRNRNVERRLSLEVMKPCALPHFALNDDFDDESDSDEPQVIHNENMMKLLKGSKTKEVDVNCALLPDEKVVVRVFKNNTAKKISTVGGHSASSSRKKMEYHSDESISTLGLGSASDRHKSRKTWVEEKCYSMRDIRILKRYKSTIDVCFTKECGQCVQQTLVFRSGGESKSFFESIIAYQDIEEGFRQENPALDDNRHSTSTLVTITESEDGME